MMGTLDGAAATRRRIMTPEDYINPANLLCVGNLLVVGGASTSDLDLLVIIARTPTPLRLYELTLSSSDTRAWQVYRAVAPDRLGKNDVFSQATGRELHVSTHLGARNEGESATLNNAVAAYGANAAAETVTTSPVAVLTLVKAETVITAAGMPHTIRWGGRLQLPEKTGIVVQCGGIGASLSAYVTFAAGA